MGSRKKLTHEEYIESCKVVHDNFYIYTNTQYINSRTKVEIECPLHGLFTQKAEAHKSGLGCYKCGNIKKSKGSKPTTTKESFIQRARAVHGDRYGYDAVVYTKSHDKVSIRCEKHGLFYQTPKCHVKGRGCIKCANDTRNDAVKFDLAKTIERCREVHGDKYDYSAVSEVGDKTSIPIFCKVHQNTFHQVVSNHLQGSGCPHCATTGYRTNLPGTLYVLRDKSATKIGITNKTVEQRRKQINRNSGKNFIELMTLSCKDGQVIADLETECLRHFRANGTSVPDKYDGSTECFIGLKIFDILRVLAQHTKLPMIFSQFHNPEAV